MANYTKPSTRVPFPPKHVITGASSLNPPELIQSPLQEPFSLWSVRGVGHIPVPDLFGDRVPGTAGPGVVHVHTELDPGTRERATVNRDEHGRIICLFCSTPSGKAVGWCAHQRLLAVTGADAALYEFTVPDGLEASLRVVVPMIPSEGIFLLVELIRPADGPMVRVRLPLQGGPARTLGVLVAGQFGARELRLLLEDHLAGHLADDRQFRQRLDLSGQPLGTRIFAGLTGKTVKEFINDRDAPRL